MLSGMHQPVTGLLFFPFFWLCWVFGLVGYWIACLTFYLSPCLPDPSEVGEMPPPLPGCHWLCKGLARRLTVYCYKLIPCSLSLALAGSFPSLPPTLSSASPPARCSASRLICHPPPADGGAVALSATVVARDRTGGSGSPFGCLRGVERGWGVVAPSLGRSLGCGVPFSGVVTWFQCDSEPANGTGHFACEPRAWTPSEEVP